MCSLRTISLSSSEISSWPRQFPWENRRTKDVRVFISQECFSNHSAIFGTWGNLTESLSQPALFCDDLRNILWNILELEQLPMRRGYLSKIFSWQQRTNTHHCSNCRLKISCTSVIINIRNEASTNIELHWSNYKRLHIAIISSSSRPGSKAFTGKNYLLVIFLKVYMAMEPDLAHG